MVCKHCGISVDGSIMDHLKSAHPKPVRGGGVGNLQRPNKHNNNSSAKADLVASQVRADLQEALGAQDAAKEILAEATEVKQEFFEMQKVQREIARENDPVTVTSKKIESLRVCSELDTTISSLQTPEPVPVPTEFKEKSKYSSTTWYNRLCFGCCRRGKNGDRFGRYNDAKELKPSSKLPGVMSIGELNHTEVPFGVYDFSLFFRFLMYVQSACVLGLVHFFVIMMMDDVGLVLDDMTHLFWFTLSLVLLHFQGEGILPAVAKQWATWPSLMKLGKKIKHVRLVLIPVSTRTHQDDQRPEMDRGERFADHRFTKYHVAVEIRRSDGFLYFKSWHQNLPKQWYKESGRTFKQVTVNTGLISTVLNRRTMNAARDRPELTLDTMMRLMSSNSHYQEDYKSLFEEGSSIYRDMALCFGALVTKSPYIPNQHF